MRPKETESRWKIIIFVVSKIEADGADQYIFRR